MENEAYLVPNPATPGQPIRIDPEVCTGCNVCADQCRRDVMVHNPVKGGPPLVVYPDECWFCGTCVEDCPTPGAIRMVHTLNQRVPWKRKATGRFYRGGMKDTPPPNPRPPVG